MSAPFPEDSRGLRERLQRRERQIEAVLRITEALHARTELGELARQTLLAAVETVGAIDGTIFLHEPKDSALVFKYVIGAAAPMLIGTAIRDDQGIAGHVFQSGEPEITVDAASAKDFDPEVARRIGHQTRNMATLPLKTAQGQVIGVMQVLNKKEGVFDEDDQDVLSILSSLAASAIHTARLYQEARLAEVVNLIGDISHDIKNMVTPVVTGAQTLELMLQSMFDDLDRLLGNGGVPDGVASQVNEACAGVREWYPEAMQMTYDGTQATTERVREIADAIKGIVSEPHFEPTNVNDVAEQVAKILRSVADRSGVLLDLSGLNGVPVAELDKKRMYNALYNLVNNAIPETPRGGTIFLRTDLVNDESGEERLQIEVADTGRGMPEDVKARLFTDQAKSTKPGGTGLGTRIVKKVIDAHRGTIIVESEAGVGTTFRIRLPLRQSE